MRGPKLTSVVILGALLTLHSSFAWAQVPQLTPIPESLSGQQREELTSRRSTLESQWTVLRSKVDSHNQKCASVPANTPLANECRQHMSLLQAEIAAYIEAVKSFNQMVDQLATTMQPREALPLLAERDEIELGRQIARELDGQLIFITDPQVTNYVQGLVDRLARVSTRSGIAYTVRVCTSSCIIRDREGRIVTRIANASSFPGGYIYINASFLRTLGNESELAAVLAHEVGHIAGRHQAQNMDSQIRATGISALLGGPVWPLLQPAVFMKFKRDHEREADRLAVEMLYQAGIKPTGLITVFERIRRERMSRTTTPPNALEALHEVYFASHPSERERVQDLEPLLADPRFNEIRVIDSAEFQTVRARLVSP